MKDFSVPVIYTISGWIRIQAADLAEAKAKALILNDDGIEMFDIKDGDCSSECFAEDTEEIEP